MRTHFLCIKPPGFDKHLFNIYLYEIFIKEKKKMYRCEVGIQKHIFTYPAFLTAPVQLNEAAAVPVCLPRYGEF